MEIVWNADLAITLFFQSLGAWLVTPMRFLSLFGQEQFFMLVMPAIYWCLSASIGIRVGAMLLLGGSFNGYLKVLAHSPRPFWFSTQVHAYSMETSFGMPSGHAQNAAGIWGLLAALIRRSWVWITLLIFIFLIGISRIYLGMHFTEDVIAGWLLGFLLVLLFMRLDRPVSAWLSRQRFATLASLALLSALAIIALHYLSVFAVSAWQMPPDWVRNANPDFPRLAEGPFSASGQITSAGVWFGFAVGLAWMRQVGGFYAGGPASQRFLRYLIGGVGVLVFYLGLGAIFPDGENLTSFTLRFIRYTLVGLWVSAGAPLIFLRFHLAKPARPVEVSAPLQPEPSSGG